MFGFIFILLVYFFIFILGLIVSSYLLSPIPLTGSIMTNYIDKNIENDLQKIVIIPPSNENNILKLRGTFKVSYKVYNNTPFSGALSIYMNVSYLPQSGSKSNDEKCFGDSVYKYVYKYNYKNVKSDELNFFKKNEYKYENVSIIEEDILKKKRFGSLITLEKVNNEKDIEDKNIFILETTIYNTFLSYPLIGNKIQIIPKISKGINEIVILITLETEIDIEKEPYITKRLIYDCQNGFLTMKLDSSLQRFDTMLFSGNMLPTSFLPVPIKCVISPDNIIMDKITEIARNQRKLYNTQQYILKKLNTSLNM